MAFLLVSTLLLSSLCRAADIGTYSYQTSPNLTPAAITSFNASANSTSFRQVDSIIATSPFNLSRIGAPYPKYNLTLAVSEHAAPSASGSSITQSLIFVTPPTDSAIRDGANITSWTSCALIFRSLTAKATEDGQGGDISGCYSALGGECISALDDMVVKSGNEILNVGCGSLLQDLPAACNLTLAGNSGAVNVKTIDLQPSRNSTASIPLLLTTSEPHDPANTTYYEEFSTRVWPVLVYQSVDNTGTDAAPQQKAASAEMKCLRASSRKPTPSGTTSATPTPTETKKGGAGARLGVSTRGLSVTLMALGCGLAMVV